MANREQQLKAALNEVALLQHKLNELGLPKSAAAIEQTRRVIGLEISDILKGDQLKSFRKKLDTDIDAILDRPSSKTILDMHRKGQAYIPQKEWEAWVKIVRKTGRPPKEKTLWDSPAAQRLVKGLKRKRSK